MRCKGLESDEDIATWVAGRVWVYYMLKVSELLDTVFFVLRKSLRQISKLHLHHHILMVIAAWAAITYYPGGVSSFRWPVCNNWISQQYCPCDYVLLLSDLWAW
ncbi:unnamed protein product, partial [Brenthis ino]